LRAHSGSPNGWASTHRRVHRLDFGDASVDHRLQWQGFFKSLKERLGFALTTRLNYLEERVASAELQKQQAQFDFSRLWLLKENLALIYLAINFKEVFLPSSVLS
jgi:hypothetical protein